ncbi:putative orfan [Tupanvirus soda lake]|uniref:Orfan n=2 Tax=Tupanvirus TaxID=2094720 RepID=A0AC62AAY6_9VIRU|nr:putative orfan [Tupanvirus soda lake]QKU34793.1 putative orfan [Tupanvirus soda lake]
MLIQKMANKLFAFKNFDYVFLNVGYTNRLMKNEINNRVDADDLCDFFAKEIDTSSVLLAVGDYKFLKPKNEWDDCELYCDNETLKFLESSKISPFGCIVIKDAEDKVSLFDIACVIESLQKINFCHCLSTTFYSMEIYEHEGKIIAMVNYDTESG